MWAAGAGGILLYYDGSAWKQLSSGPARTLFAVWTDGSGEGWAVGEGGTILHRQAGRWSQAMSPTTTTLRGLHGSGPSDLWAAGGGGLLVHYDGVRWTTVQSPVTADLYAVWAGDPLAGWAVGAQGTVLSRNGATWVQVAAGVTSSTLRAVSRDAMGRVFAAGDNGTVLQGPTTWQLMPPPSTNDLQAVFPIAPGSVWMSGGVGSVARWDIADMAYAKHDIGSLSYQSLAALWGRSDSDIWTAGTSGAWAYWNGTLWRELDSATDTALNGMIGTPTAELWLVGQAGTILHKP